MARSSAEVEFMSIAFQVTWLEGLYKEQGVNMTRVQLFCDSKATIKIVANSIFHERTKHIDINCHFVRRR